MSIPPVDFHHGLLEQVARSAIGTTGVSAGDRLLDLACGTGLIARAARATHPPSDPLTDW